ncbi:MAG: alpha/beta hydrolase [Gemmatimonas sp.]|nr:alpha/beta hydrolase [Gemmatimonas sp.]
MRGEFVDLHGVRLYCYAFGQRGAGNPIVLVHGSFTSSHLWQDVLPRLPKGHRVLVLDLLGHGRSDPPGTADMSVAGHAARLAQLLDVMGVPSAMLVGHGMGAAIAARVAHEQPARIAHLMLVNPTLLAATAPEARLNRRVRRLAMLVPLWKRLAPSWLASALHAALLPGFAHRDVGARALDVYLQPFRLRDGRDAACAQLVALNRSRGDTVDALAPGALHCPTALVLGDADPFLNAARSARLVTWIGQATNTRATIHQLPGVAHVAPEEAPDRLGTLVGELLTR